MHVLDNVYYHIYVPMYGWTLYFLYVRLYSRKKNMMMNFKKWKNLHRFKKMLFFHNRLPFPKSITTTKRKTIRRKTRMPTSTSQMKTRLRARRGNPRTDVRFTARTRTRNAGTGPEDWTSSCPCWDTAWGWGTSGGSPTCVIGTAEGRFCCHL